MTEQCARTDIAAFPELPVRDVAFLGKGVFSHAYLVNDKWVFRFPKREAAARALSREVALLPKLAGRLPGGTKRPASWRSTWRTPATAASSPRWRRPPSAPASRSSWASAT